MEYKTCDFVWVFYLLAQEAQTDRFLCSCSIQPPLHHYGHRTPQNPALHYPLLKQHMSYNSRPWIRQWKANCFTTSSLIDKQLDRDTGSTDKNNASIYCQKESARWLINVINILKIQTLSCDDDLQAWFTFLTGSAAQNGLELHACDIHCVSRIRQGGGVQRGCGEKTANSSLRRTADWHTLVWVNDTDNLSCSYPSSRGNRSNPEERRVVDEN